MQIKLSNETLSFVFDNFSSQRSRLPQYYRRILKFQFHSHLISPAGILQNSTYSSRVLVADVFSYLIDVAEPWELKKSLNYPKGGRGACKYYNVGQELICQRRGEGRVAPLSHQCLQPCVGTADYHLWFQPVLASQQKKSIKVGWASLDKFATLFFLSSITA